MSMTMVTRLPARARIEEVNSESQIQTFKGWDLHINAKVRKQKRWNEELQYIREMDQNQGVGATMASANTSG